MRYARGTVRHPPRNRLLMCATRTPGVRPAQPQVYLNWLPLEAEAEEGGGTKASWDGDCVTFCRTAAAALSPLSGPMDSVSAPVRTGYGLERVQH